MENIYPANPEYVPADLTRPSSQYKRHAWIAMASLLIFFILYLSLAGWFSWTAYRTIKEGMNGDHWEYFLVGFCAAFMAVFMLKALFFVQKGVAPDAVEVTAQDQPRLFEYLYRLADDAGAPRPARVFLSARVNACVFYDLSILNLVFPSRKNIEIGLALVNVLTLSEMKAVMAHEFGHFAQRTMAIGNWVYIAHQIAAHLVASRDMLDKFLQTLSRTDIRVAWIGWLLSLIVWSVRSLMDTLLRLVLLAQRALSRQMEFQADLVAVSLTGSDELVHALHKLQAADESWGRAIGFARSEISNGKLPHDVFEIQSRIIKKVSTILNDKHYGAVPEKSVDNPGQHRVFKASFARPPQMWSTHPSSSDREENVKREYLSAPHDPRSAWLLFDDVDNTKQKVVAMIFGEKNDIQKMDIEETSSALDKKYGLLQYDSRYQGVYLGRSVVRHAKNSTELYQDLMGQLDIKRLLSGLYGKKVSDDLEKLRELVEERLMLEAVRDRVYESTENKIIFRGKEVSRRGLPSVIQQVIKEEDAVRERVIVHDKKCRSIHLAAAKKLGGNAHAYLVGLIQVLHYMDHTLADLQDAHGFLGNVLAIVLADQKVSAGELKRVIASANMLHEVMADIYKNKLDVKLDVSICEALGVASWGEMLGDFQIPPASEGNINEWMQAIDGWVGFVSFNISRVIEAALEKLLLTESQIEKSVHGDHRMEELPVASVVPATYKTLLPGQERKRQKKLDLWSRFQTSDGVFFGAIRLVVAISFVGGVMFLSGSVASTAAVTIYNALDREVIVEIADKKMLVRPNHGFLNIEIPVDRAVHIETRTREGEVIESFDPQLTGHVEHYIYNVAQASPLVEWTAVYGNARETKPHLLGAPRWTSRNVDFYFTEPPESVKTKGGGATKTVLSGAKGYSTEEIMNLLSTDQDRMTVILAHAKWDNPASARAAEWQEYARFLQYEKILHVCRIIPHAAYEQLAMFNFVSPSETLVNDLMPDDQVAAANLAPNAEVSLLFKPEHGEWDSLANRYLPETGYMGADQMDFEVKLDNKLYRIRYSVFVIEDSPDFYTGCTEEGPVRKENPAAAGI